MYYWFILLCIVCTYSRNQRNALLTIVFIHFSLHHEAENKQIMHEHRGTNNAGLKFKKNF